MLGFAGDNPFDDGYFALIAGFQKYLLFFLVRIHVLIPDILEEGVDFGQFVEFGHEFVCFFFPVDEVDVVFVEVLDHEGFGLVVVDALVEGFEVFAGLQEGLFVEGDHLAEGKLLLRPLLVEFSYFFHVLHGIYFN